MSTKRTLTRSRWLLSLGTLVLLGCPQDVTPLVSDAGARDAGTRDAEVPDSGLSLDAAVSIDAAAPDTGRVDAGIRDTGSADSGRQDASLPVDAGPRPDAGFTPNEPCEALILPCLDSSRPDVYSVPDEISFSDALDAVQAGQTIQIRGRNLSSGIRVPPGVNFYGCEGSDIVGVIGFEGISGRVEGFLVSGGIVANQTGSYIIRRNRFTATPTDPTAIRASAIDGIVGASVTVLVEQNSFVDRSIGIEASTRYDTMTRAVDIQIRNNIFKNVESPVRISEAGLVGTVESIIEHNTFFDFDEAVRIDSVGQLTTLKANLFSVGNRAVAGNAPYGVEFCFGHALLSPNSTPPFTGTIGNADPKFIDPQLGDFRLSWDSPVVDIIPAGAAVPALDYYGCPRPARLVANRPTSDVGALEAQP